MNKQHQSDLFTEENLRTIAALLIDLPGSELRVMQILAQMDTGWHAPMIVRSSQGTITTGSVYTLLKRIIARSNGIYPLLHANEVMVQNMDIESKRVVYSVDAAVKACLQNITPEAITAAVIAQNSSRTS